ncbi:MAG: agmatine deiminase family protein [Bdellovibrionota bacterium]
MTPKSAGYRMPAEWERHAAVWLAWPSAEDLWLEDLEPAREEFVSFCEAIADLDPEKGDVRGEKMEILVPDIASGALAERRLGHLPVRLHLVPFGDIWLRDTGPVFLKGTSGEIATMRFGFNGWGGKFDLPHDPVVAEKIASAAGYPEFALPWICEGGSLEVDGEGTCITTEQCLLNPNRNPGMTKEKIEELVRDSLGVTKVLWLGQGLLNDHTDGHVDTIARFVSPGHVIIHSSSDQDDPNKDILESIDRDVRGFTDAKGRELRITRVPSPGRVLNEDGDLMPASYLNFYIGNSTVVVPTYGAPNDEAAVTAIRQCFPTRKTIGLPSKAILTGGGAFHCMSQQQPI